MTETAEQLAAEIERWLTRTTHISKDAAYIVMTGLLQRAVQQLRATSAQLASWQEPPR